MISVDVFHVNIKAMTGEAGHLLPGMMFSPSEREVQKAIDLGLYLKTATLSVDASDVPSALEFTYERTQHFEREWQSEKGVTLYVDAVRSSMTGDVFVINGTAYLVAMVGFKPLPAWPTSPPHPDAH